MASRIHFKHWENILISRLYEQFSRNDSEMAPEWLSEKISAFQNMNILYVALKHVTWRSRICNYFHEIFKILDFTKTFSQNLFLLIFSRNLKILRNNLY